MTPAVVARIALYLCAALLPALAALFFVPSTGRFIVQWSRFCALTAFALLVLQFVLAARIKWIERACGFDILIRYHQHMALFAGALLLMHPLLLAVGGGGWHLLFGLDLPLTVWLGKATLAVVLINIAMSRFQTRLNLKYETWRRGHDILGPLIIAMAFLHSWFIGSDLSAVVMKVLWAVALVTAAAYFTYHRIARPKRLKKEAYHVIGVHAEADQVWTVNLTPPKGVPVYDYLPGQFHFITFYRDARLPVEEHHWTLSSSPTQKGVISSTIKAVGDFTATIGQTRIGDRAAVHGAFGRFSYILHPEERDLVFLVGGIGITPLMSMLRHMHDTADTRSVLLVYANDKRQNIVFRQPLEEIAASGHPRLRIVQVLSQPDDGWSGEIGFIDREKIQRLCGSGLEEKVFYVCGPAPMTDGIVRTLKDLKVPDKRIRLEIFSFLD